MHRRPGSVAAIIIGCVMLASCASTSTTAQPTLSSASAPPATDLPAFSTTANLTTTVPPDATASEPPNVAANTTVPATSPAASTVPTTALPSATSVRSSTASIPTSTNPVPANPAPANPAPANPGSLPHDSLGRAAGTYTIGTSVDGRPILAVRRGTPGGRRVLVIGVIHGDEQAGLAIVDRLKTIDVPANIDLWLVESMNPDGVAANSRLNTNGVDLNRNFPYKWAPIGAPGNWEYPGPRAASEPETQAMVGFMTLLQPELTIWYHQDYNRIAPTQGRDGAVRARYSALTGIPLLNITGGTYTGVAAQWARATFPKGVAFIVELGPTLNADEAAVHAAAVVTISREFL